jgi:uncharacterized membrane protein YfcA
MSLPEWTAFPVCIVIATVVNLTGIGGGILLTPFFVAGLGIQPHSAVLLSLCTQVVGQSSGTLAYIRAGKTDIRLGLLYGALGIPGVFLGANLSHYLSELFLELALGAVCLLVASFFVLTKDVYGEEGIERVSLKEAKKLFWLPMLTAIGSGMLSVGISDWLIPMMRHRLNLKMTNAVATAIFSMLIIAISGTIFQLLLHTPLRTDIMVWSAMGVFIGGQIGSRLSPRISDYRLKELFIFLLMLSGIHILFNAV